MLCKDRVRNDSYYAESLISVIVFCKKFNLILFLILCTILDISCCKISFHSLVEMADLVKLPHIENI